MNEFLTDYGLFLAKTVTVVLAFAVMVGLAMAGGKNRGQRRGELRVDSLNAQYRERADALKDAMFSKKERKTALKAQKAEEKKRRKQEKLGLDDDRQRVFVLDFHGDIRASQVAELRETITSVLQVSEPGDEIVVRLESPGGQVHGYGLAASQLARIREHNINLTVAVDKVAASGGYMMACVADRILAAPFAILGSIGVVAQIPNFHRLLQRHDIDFEQHTAGPYKRTLSLFAENTEEGRKKFQEELEDTHELFKSFVKEHRPRVNIDELATGEHWYGTRALDHKLVDEIRTSDDYLMTRAQGADIYAVRYEEKKNLGEKLNVVFTRVADRWLGVAS